MVFLVRNLSYVFLQRPFSSMRKNFWSFGASKLHTIYWVWCLHLRMLHFNLVYYNFGLVPGDADDNKFADLYLAASADILVSNDRKLLQLNSADFPTIRAMTLPEFTQYLFDNTK